MIPGLFTESKVKGRKFAEPIEHAGWNGEIHYLCWDASEMESMLKTCALWGSALDPVGVPVGFAAKMKSIHHKAKASRARIPT